MYSMLFKKFCGPNRYLVEVWKTLFVKESPRCKYFSDQMYNCSVSATILFKYRGVGREIHTFLSMEWIMC